MVDSQMRIQFKRSILLAGREHAGKGSIWNLPQVLALELIAQESAVRCGFFRLIFLRATGVDVKPRALPAARSDTSYNNGSPGVTEEMKLMEATRNTKRIRLTRSLLLRGGEAQEGDVLDLPIELADDLIFTDSAVPCDAQVTKQMPAEREKRDMRKVKLLRSITMGQAGEVHEVPFHVACSLISDKSAEPQGWSINPRDFSEWD
jgi:hypothetical protein